MAIDQLHDADLNRFVVLAILDDAWSIDPQTPFPNLWPVNSRLVPPDVQLRTNKHDNFATAVPQHFQIELTSDLESMGQNTSKNSVFKLFPCLFGTTKILTGLNTKITYDAVSRTASMDIIALRDTWRCPFCSFTAHSAAFPVRPILYADMNRQERLINLRITSVGHASSCCTAHRFASSNVLFFTSR